MKTKTKNTITFIGLSVIAFIFVFSGLCVAYDNWMLNHLETSLNESITAIEGSKKRCTLDYEALVKYKTESKIELKGTGNPCF